jgi:hypothetical protein
MVGVHNQKDVLRANLETRLVAVAAPGGFKEIEYPVAPYVKRNIERGPAASARDCIKCCGYE